MLIKSSAGFSLVEMAMVLAIVALLLGGLLPTLSAQRESQHISETRKQLDEIQQALIGYAIINGRLPCPAQATLATGQPNAGEEATTGDTCACKTASGSDKTIADASASNVACTDTTVTGVLPWVTLGIKETDAWERRYTYRIATHFADQIAANTFGSGCTPNPTPAAASFALCSAGVPDVFSAATGGTSVATDVPVLLLSHGRNGFGAYINNGTQLTGATSDEAENSDNDNNFVSHTPTPDFDDLVAWLSSNILLNRMVMAGKLP